MVAALTRTERSVLARLAADDARSLGIVLDSEYYDVRAVGEPRVGRRVQRRIVLRLEARGYIRYESGAYRLTDAARAAAGAA